MERGCLASGLGSTEEGDDRKEQIRDRLEQGAVGRGGAGGEPFGSIFLVGVEWRVTLRHPSGDSRKGGSIVRGFARGIQNQESGSGSHWCT